MSREPGLPPDPLGPPDVADRAELESLAATRAELAALPAPPVPPDVEARWAAALAVESAADGATPPPSHRLMDPSGGPEAPADRHMGPRGDAESVPERHMGPRGAERRRWAGRPLLAAAALAAVVAAGVGVLLPERGANEPPALAVARVDLVAVATAAVGTTDVGDLADPDRRVGCLRTVAPAALDEQLLGGRRVVLDGRPGVLLVLATGTRGGLRIVTVDPGCGPEGGTLLAQVVVG